MAMIEDLGVFFDTDEFAVTATLAGGGTMPVIFERAHLEVLGVSTASPVALAQAAHVTAHGIVAGRGITIPDPNGGPDQQFSVRDLEPDGPGLILLILEAS